MSYLLFVIYPIHGSSHGSIFVGSILLCPIHICKRRRVKIGVRTVRQSTVRPSSVRSIRREFDRSADACERNDFNRGMSMNLFEWYSMLSRIWYRFYETNLLDLKIKSTRIPLTTRAICTTVREMTMVLIVTSSSSSRTQYRLYARNLL